MDNVTLSSFHEFKHEESPMDIKFDLLSPGDYKSKNSVLVETPPEEKTGSEARSCLYRPAKEEIILPDELIFYSDNVRDNFKYATDRYGNILPASIILVRYENDRVYMPCKIRKTIKGDILKIVIFVDMADKVFRITNRRYIEKLDKVEIYVYSVSIKRCITHNFNFTSYFATYQPTISITVGGKFYSFQLSISVSDHELISGIKKHKTFMKNFLDRKRNKVKPVPYAREEKSEKSGNTEITKNTPETPQ